MASKKEKLRGQCEQLGVAYQEKDNIKTLQKKLINAPATVQTDETQMPYALMDAEDDKQILASMRGAQLEDFVYYFEQKSKTPGKPKIVVGLSKAGVDELCRQSARKEGVIYEFEGIVSERHDGEYFEITVKVGSYKIIFDRKKMQSMKISLGSHSGSKRQWKKMRLRDGTIRPDDFWYEKAFTKAERNAKHDLLPYQFIKTSIRKYLQHKKRQTGDKSNVKQIQLDSLISTAELQIIHGVGTEYGMDHNRITRMAKDRRMIQASINELRKSQVQNLIELIKGRGRSQRIEIPYKLIGYFNALDYKKAMQEAMWTNALKIRRNNKEAATEDLVIKLKAEGKRKGIKL